MIRIAFVSYPLLWAIATTLAGMPPNEVVSMGWLYRRAIEWEQGPVDPSKVNAVVLAALQMGMAKAVRFTRPDKASWGLLAGGAFRKWLGRAGVAEGWMIDARWSRN